MKIRCFNGVNPTNFMEDAFMDISIEVSKEVIIEAKLDRLVDGLDRFLFMIRNEDFKRLAPFEVLRIRKVIKELNEIYPEGIKEAFESIFGNAPEETKQIFINLFDYPI